MSSEEEDWENQCDSDNDKEEEKKEVEKKAAAAKFADEDAIDPIELAKKKKEEIKRLQEEQQQNGRNKIANKVDYDKIYAERQAKIGVIVPDTKKGEDAKGSSAAKGIVLEKAAEEGLANQLFGDDETGPTVSLSSEKDYLNFAKQVSDALYKGNAPYHIEKFFKKLAEEMPQHCDSKHIKGVADYLQTSYNNKVKEERKLDKNVKKKAAVLKGGGGKGYDRNNNSAMINDVMGADYGDEYGEEKPAFKKEEEAEIDFM